jgi:hypothetical protein
MKPNTQCLLVYQSAGPHWGHAHNQQATRHGGVRLLTWCLPIKSPRLNPLEPHWVQGRRAIVEPTSLLTTAEIITSGLLQQFLGIKALEFHTGIFGPKPPLDGGPVASAACLPGGDRRGHAGHLGTPSV